MLNCDSDNINDNIKNKNNKYIDDVTKSILANSKSFVCDSHDFTSTDNESSLSMSNRPFFDVKIENSLKVIHKIK